MSVHLIELIQSWGEPRVLVLGDLILDRYVWGDAERVSQEAPVVLLRADHEESRPGGAANVANMVRGLGARVELAGVVGHDAAGAETLAHLESRGIGCSALAVDANRPTTVKERFIGRAQQRHPHQMLRVDREVRCPLDPELEAALLEKTSALLDEVDVVLVSDYAKGVCTPRLLRETLRRARAAGIPVVVDPGPGVDYAHYVQATAVTPNRLETSLAARMPVPTVEAAGHAGRRLVAQYEFDFAFVTLDRDGMVLVDRTGRADHLPTRRREVYDITGAGDMVLATIGVALAAGQPADDAGRLANVAGGLEVEQVGVVCISREQMMEDLLRHSRELPAKICRLPALLRQVAARRRLGQRIVFTNGCFDLLHLGHVTLLQQAKREGDCLIVAVNSDDSVRRLNKGPERPICPQDERAAVLAALEAVDFVVIFDESTPHALLEAIRPDVLVKGGTYAREEIVGREIVEAYGGTVKPLGRVPGLSTTQIVQRLLAPEQRRKAG